MSRKAQHMGRQFPLGPNPGEVNSEAAARRRDAYDRSLAAIHLINPNAVPIAAPHEPYAIERLADQARHTVAPPGRKPSPEGMLHSRVSNMQNAVANLVAEARGKGIAAELPPNDLGGDLGARLQELNALHDKLEKQIAYFNGTTQEQRAIDDLRADIKRIRKRLDGTATALAALGELLPLLMKKAEGK
jgi:hypothetical protein